MRGGAGEQKLRVLFSLGLLVLLLGVGLLLKALGVDLTRFTPEAVSHYVHSFGVWAPAVYLLAYGQPIVPLPASLMTITAGVAFGPWWGSLAALCGATMRACSQYLVARLLGRETVAKLLKGKAAALDRKLGAHGFKAVLLIRLIPSFPFDVLNYGLGFSQVRFLPYAAASFLGMIPASFAYVYLGHSLTDPKQLWKLLLAILLIAGLILLQQAFKTKPSPPPAVETPP